MKQDLSKEEKMIIDEVRRIVRREIAPLAAELDERGGFIRFLRKTICSIRFCRFNTAVLASPT